MSSPGALRRKGNSAPRVSVEIHLGGRSVVKRSDVDVSREIAEFATFKVESSLPQD